MYRRYPVPTKWNQIMLIFVAKFLFACPMYSVPHGINCERVFKVYLFLRSIYICLKYIHIIHIYIYTYWFHLTRLFLFSYFLCLFLLIVVSIVFAYVVIIPLASSHILRWWLGCENVWNHLLSIIFSFHASILRRWLDAYFNVPLEVCKWLGSVGYNPSISHL